MNHNARFEALQDACRRLDQHYISTRYPNGLPGGIPYEVYTRDQAHEAIAGAKRVLEQVEQLVPSQ